MLMKLFPRKNLHFFGNKYIERKRKRNRTLGWPKKETKCKIQDKIVPLSDPYPQWGKFELVEILFWIFFFLMKHIL